MTDKCYFRTDRRCAIISIYVYNINSYLKNTQKDIPINYILQLTCISMKYDPSQSITSRKSSQCFNYLYFLGVFN